MVAVLVILTIVVFVALDVALMAWRRRRAVAPAHETRLAMLEPRPPQGVFLHPSHGWVRIQPDGTLRVGLDDFLTEAMGELETVATAARGSKMRRGDPLITLHFEGKKLVVPAPASGEVVGVNERALASPHLVSRDPYGAGWLVSLWTPDHQEAIRPLRIGAGATAYLRQELERFIDFLGGQGPEPALLLADGGLPDRGAVQGLDDTGVQAFAESFLAAEKNGE